MGKVYFRTGPMNCGKSMHLIAAVYNFRERGIEVVVIKPSIDTRDGGVIKSRALNTTLDVVSYKSEDNIYDDLKDKVSEKTWIVCDESQFLTAEQVNQLARLADDVGLNVICYGLKTDFNTNLFPGSKRLLEIADTIEELKSTCSCGRKAMINARVDSSGNIVTDGPQIECGGNEKYLTLCRKCYYQKLKEQEC